MPADLKKALQGIKKSKKHQVPEYDPIFGNAVTKTLIYD